jgi:hypothetical protein
MSSPKYHREQAKILAGLALSTPDATKADHFKLAAMEHLEKAAEGSDTSRAHGHDPDQDATK